MINIIGLGPGAADALTLGSLRLLKNSDDIMLRTAKHPTIDFINDEGINYLTYDYAYDKFKSFDEVYDFIAKDLVEKHKEKGDLVYAVPGHPLVAEKSVELLIHLAEEENIEVNIVPAVSFIDAVLESLKLDPVKGLKLIDAFDMANQIPDKRVGTVITQVYNKFIASEVKIKLLDFYEDETEIFFVRAAGIKGEESIRKIKLYELDWQEDIDYLTSLYIPEAPDNKKDFYEFVDIIDTLRAPGGCPWDREQSHDSLKKALIEESYEVIEAIEEMDDNKLVEELGDLLLQVVFHASIGKEEGYFNINDVVEGISKKMIYRHPHVFGDTQVSGSKEVLKNWDELKRKEQGLKTTTDELNHVAKSLPALIRAEKVQKKASKVGFDWDKAEDALNKIFEEAEELKDVYKLQNKAKILDEMGDLLFAAVNTCRFLNIDPEEALNSTTNKFIKRFSYVEKCAMSMGKTLNDMSLKDMDFYWDEAKKYEKNEK
ncbi:tetrapyrrole methylase family protein / MazG family protein [Clostridium amylolyticum]|uniref:Tetrapyrrole methylase family protein / MazG family protein n=1 Tax=Clostridium amylolyticum TaxID=1121298 RepID=A0A1M6LI75_9CLOT|nr:nucleoside triphosphate pyrophosphohydrolase [Clostridium amylolyticum]SHJ70861.1 tetrapyrrole methylase family protein / MazG family protein [Clostridium amylolyticum]